MFEVTQSQQDIQVQFFYEECMKKLDTNDCIRQSTIFSDYLQDEEHQILKRTISIEYENENIFRSQMLGKNRRFMNENNKQTHPSKSETASFVQNVPIQVLKAVPAEKLTKQRPQIQSIINQQSYLIKKDFQTRNRQQKIKQRLSHRKKQRQIFDQKFQTLILRSNKQRYQKFIVGQAGQDFIDQQSIQQGQDLLSNTIKSFGGYLLTTNVRFQSNFQIMHQENQRIKPFKLNNLIHAQGSKSQQTFSPRKRKGIQKIIQKIRSLYLQHGKL